MRELTKRAYPELRNRRYESIYDEARAKRFALALAGNDCQAVPLYSHNTTYQSVFSKGWCSVTEQDIRLAAATKKYREQHV